MERMTPKDAAILELEDDVSAAHGLTVGIFEGPEPTFEELLERIADRISLVPRYRQRLVRVPLGIERPVWVDDPTFSLDFHVRHTALPERTDRNSFNAFVSRQLSQRLDHGKPLWEVWMVSRLPKKQWAIVSKVHYAIIDGVSGADVLGLLADSVETNGRSSMTVTGALPNDSQLIRDAVLDMALDPMEAYRATRSLLQKPYRAVRHLGSTLVDTRDPDGLGRAIGPNRRWQPAVVALDDLRIIRKKHGCSTTDVILAAVAGGIRNYLKVNGKPIPKSVDALVPLSVGAASGHMSGQISTLTGRLPIAEDDPVARLMEIHAQTSSGAAKSGAIAGDVLRRQDDFVAPTILGQGVRSTMLEVRDRRSFDTVAINVPGPAHTINVLNRAMVEAYPVIPLPGRVQIAMAAMSLGDQVYFGITSDWDTTSGLRYAAAGVTETIAELLTA